MSKVVINESTLTSIGAAIREKTGKTDLIAPGNMPAEIRAIPTGGGGGAEVEPIVFSGDCSYLFNAGNWDWAVELFGDKMSTKDMSGSKYMFGGSALETIPFELNYDSSKNSDMASMFRDAKNLKSIPKINNCKPYGTEYMFYNCRSLRELPANFGSDFDWTYLDSLTTGSLGSRGNIFGNCHSLRSIPMEFLNHGNPAGYSSYCIYGGNSFSYCHALDELVGLPYPHRNATWTSNVFSLAFQNLNRLKNLIFATPDGLPYVVKWKKQTIDLTNYVGYAQSVLDVYSEVLKYNSGITAETKVTDDATYQALKDNPDWWTTKIEYSRYNHDSAVATINSLPDTSAYLATQTSGTNTNTIKFKGAAGSLTDGGAINTLTEEEIAVATAKGWTVTLV